MSRLILASTSPRRREILREMGVKFEVATADVNEFAELSPELRTAPDLALANARHKAIAVARANPGRWVLGADTVVYLQAQLFGKPRDMAEARQFLRVLSGQTHEVVTACVLIAPDGAEQSLHEISRVTLRILSEENITSYLTAVHVLDKAGAYAVQENGDWIIESVEGSRSNVIGLPVEKLTPMLKEFRGPCDDQPTSLKN